MQILFLLICIFSNIKFLSGVLIFLTLNTEQMTDSNQVLDIRFKDFTVLKVLIMFFWFKSL
jgi:hypothetical protein